MRIVRLLALWATIMMAVLSQTRSLTAQNWAVVGGAVAGAGAGAWVGLGYLSVRARGGAYVDEPGYSARQVVIPVLAGLGTGIALGVYAEDRLGDTVLWAAVGWASGVAVGALIGRRIWDDSPGPWAGAAIGGAAGLLVGGIMGFMNSGGANPSMPTMIRIPL